MKRLVRWAVAAALCYLGGAALGYVLMDRTLRNDHEADFGGDDE